VESPEQVVSAEALVPVRLADRSLALASAEPRWSAPNSQGAAESQPPAAEVRRGFPLSMWMPRAELQPLTELEPSAELQQRMAAASRQPMPALRA
jgi:hypothetical protein